ncbi:hypothetical protein, conserved [Eimeria necatrix]|uniref:Uncharacterized protein n=1 Tax=Eimeria necatrix TaxID=51315 RepID=U6MX80_9EIME|nr:hypothetical protein, conserved [Eimeria necatrix]CDJ67094.1 hypothetical protein, conserved [Eimeria necatrix]
MLLDGGYLLQLLAACRKGIKQQQPQTQQQQLHQQQLLLEANVIPEVQVCESLALAICDLLYSQYEQQLQQLLQPEASAQQEREKRTLKVSLDNLIFANWELGFKKEAGYALWMFS